LACSIFFRPRTSIDSIDGGRDNNSGAAAIKALAIGPDRCCWRPASSWKASKMPNEDGDRRSANQIGVVGSWRTRERPVSRNLTTSASLPGLASRRTNKASLGIMRSPIDGGALYGRRRETVIRLAYFAIEPRHARQ